GRTRQRFTVAVCSEFSGWRVSHEKTLSVATAILGLSRSMQNDSSQLNSILTHAEILLLK
ncbi:MAG: hypothetical protein KGJ59_06100, partial [Bacteroidota bacterium]|nr:hypothetical protein [Bacteroidota bacterium]